MAAYSRTSTLAAYKTVATHGGVATADPHRLILMLIDGALERIALAGDCLRNGTGGDKSRLIHSASLIVAELRSSLDLRAGGAIAANLDALYEYMERQLVSADLSNRVETLEEVSHLLNEIRSAWIALPADVRALRPGPR